VVIISISITLSAVSRVEKRTDDGFPFGGESLRANDKVHHQTAHDQPFWFVAHIRNLLYKQVHYTLPPIHTQYETPPSFYDFGTFPLNFSSPLGILFAKGCAYEDLI
jgi:hypothetical protein